MSGSRSTDDQPTDDTGEARALLRVTRWPGWIWAVPLAALGFVGWLMVREWALVGEEIEVRLPAAQGISTGTAVRHRGVQIGTVQAVRLDDGLERVTLDISIHSEFSDHLRSGTRFWVAQPQFGVGHVSSLLSGPHVAMAPGSGEGEATTVFEGLARPPIEIPDGDRGRSYRLHAGNTGPLAKGSPVLFDDMEVGQVAGIDFDHHQRRSAVIIFVREPYHRMVTEHSVFWQAGGVSLETGAGGLSLRFPSFTALTAGAVAFATPESLSGAEAAAGARFALHADRQRAEAQAVGPRLSYRVRFPDTLAGLEVGAPVTLRGRRIGRVAEVDLHIASGGAEIRSSVLLTLEALRLDPSLADQANRQALRLAFDRTLEGLVGAGLRARISSGTPIGGTGVELAMLADPPPARLRVVSHGLSEIPTAPAAADLSAVMASVRETADAIGETAGNVDALLTGSLRQNRGLPELIEELTAAANAIRELAAYLARQPEGLLMGRDE